MFLIARPVGEQPPKADQYADDCTDRCGYDRNLYSKAKLQFRPKPPSTPCDFPPADAAKVCYGTHMTTINLPADLEAWARAEVAAGHAESVEAAIAKGVRGYQLATDAFRKSLDDAVAEADRDGWIPAEEFFRDLDQWIFDLTLEADREDAAGRAAE